MRLIPAIIAAVALSACSSPDSQIRSKNTETHTVNGQKHFLLQTSQDEFETLVKNLDIKSKLLNQYADWKGVAYRLGGSTNVALIVQLLSSAPFMINLVWNYHVLPRSNRR